MPLMIGMQPLALSGLPNVSAWLGRVPNGHALNPTASLSV